MSTGRDILLTGLPRSGTTLLCYLLNRLPDTVALVEPLDIPPLWPLDADGLEARLRAFLAAERSRILATGRATGKSRGGQAIPNHLADDAAGDGARSLLLDSREMVVDKPLAPDFDLFVKQPAFFTARLDILSARFACFASIRNPLFVILSWCNSGMPVADGRLPFAEAVAPALQDRLDRIDDLMGRQVALVDYLFGQYRRWIPDTVLKYETILAGRGKSLAQAAPGWTSAAWDEARVSSSRNTVGPEALDMAARIAERLLADRDNACWFFYKPVEIEAAVGA